MPLLPLQVLRILEGLLSLVCFGGVLISSWVFAYVRATGQLELFGIDMTLAKAGAAIVACSLGVLWFAMNAILGGSTPTEGSERDSAREG